MQEDNSSRYMIRLRSLRHPLLYGAYLREKQSLEQRVHQEGGTIPALGGGPGSQKSAASPTRRLLGNRREVMLAQSGLLAPGSASGKAKDDGQPSAQVCCT